jgi:hypothetical protein
MQVWKTSIILQIWMNILHIKGLRLEQEVHFGYT